MIFRRRDSEHEVCNNLEWVKKFKKLKNRKLQPERMKRSLKNFSTISLFSSPPISIIFLKLERERERYGKPFIEYIKILEKSGRFREMGHRDCAQKSAPFNCNHAEHRESFVDSPLPPPPSSGLECWGKLSDFWDVEIPDRPVGGLERGEGENVEQERKMI